MQFRRATAALAAVVLATGLSGCSDDEDAGVAEPVPGATGTTSDATSAATGSSEPTAVEAAAGPEINLPTAADFHLTEGPDWDITDNGRTLVLSNAAVEGALANVRIDASEYPQIGDDLDNAAKVAARIQASRYHARLHVAGYRDLGGVQGFVLEGRGTGFNYYEWAGLDADNALVTLTFMIPTELEVADFVEPVLASFEWRS